KSIIAIIKFTPWDNLTEKDNENLNFVSTFLHGPNEFINLVSSSTCSYYWIVHKKIDSHKGEEISLVLYLACPIFPLLPKASSNHLMLIKTSFGVCFSWQNFDHQHGILKMVWKENKYKHYTLPYSPPSSTLTCLGMSLQINFSLSNAFK
ncbi:hypothetical protein VP01_2990g1, partial [Puccinia sorghi]